ncbi:hypothetical protein HDF14_002718 [Edaphobacter lichenicola]|uniref:Uncharacterized protein n=1 Tax=Tunturiibacter gelidiferens TaxID=3069689 RepID=A0A9X0QEV2_9BACT|nr:hypothetical protein [Edaphobacter lichenicola]
MPETPGYSIEIKPDSLQTYAFPHGTYWSEELVGHLA